VPLAPRSNLADRCPEQTELGRGAEILRTSLLGRKAGRAPAPQGRPEIVDCWSLVPARLRACAPARLRYGRAGDVSSGQMLILRGFV
jgi:hypothetical protein